MSVAPEDYSNEDYSNLTLAEVMAHLQALQALPGVAPYSYAVVLISSAGSMLHLSLPGAPEWERRKIGVALSPDVLEDLEDEDPGSPELERVRAYFEADDDPQGSGSFRLTIQKAAPSPWNPANAPVPS